MYRLVVTPAANRERRMNGWYLMFLDVPLYESPAGLLFTPIFKMYSSSIGRSEWFHPMVAGWSVVNLEFGWSFYLIECLDNIASPSFSSVSSLLVWECQQKPKLGLFGEVFPGKKGEIQVLLSTTTTPHMQVTHRWRWPVRWRSKSQCLAALWMWASGDLRGNVIFDSLNF